MTEPSYVKKRAELDHACLLMIMFTDRSLACSYLSLSCQQSYLSLSLASLSCLQLSFLPVELPISLLRASLASRVTTLSCLMQCENGRFYARNLHDRNQHTCGSCKVDAIPCIGGCKVDAGWLMLAVHPLLNWLTQKIQAN